MPTLQIEIERIEAPVLKLFLTSIKTLNKNHILRNELLNFFNELRPKNELASDNSKNLYVYKFLKKVQELLIIDNNFFFIYRYRIAKYNYYQINLEEDIWFKTISIEEFLLKKDFILIGDKLNPEKKPPQINLMPFYDYSPQIKDSNEIGNGILYLTRNLASNLFQNPEKWNQMLYLFLSSHCMGDLQLLLNKTIIKNHSELLDRLDFMIDLASESIANKKESNFFKDSIKLGFKPGWGNSVIRIQETMQLLKNCFNSPDPKTLELFISRIPMVSKVAVISPHGWFGQKNVLGRPDTGGQVVYILDQVKYLEKKMKEDLELAGLNVTPKILIVTRLIPECENTTCDQRLEKVNDTDNCYILRIPFRKKDGSIHPQWISRFHLWPYLESFTEEVKGNLLKEFKSKPDLIIGNYSDGNLVATLLSQQCSVMQCNIAHALEKSKYLFSDLNWESLEKKYKFSFQYTADLIAMNLTSFIITSSFQEIGGTKEAQGQYESYLTYSMPNLYHVTQGINLFHPKFNVIPPGVPENIFFSFKNNDQRNSKTTKKLEEILFDKNTDYTVGQLEDKNKKPIFSMARIDKVKNLSGLIELFAKNKELRKISNLILITDKTTIEESKDIEEKKEIKKIYNIINKYNLKSDFRWIGIGATAKREELAEVYRIMADKKGIFVQPAIFEAFGLTVLEAMSSGLPTFATKFGGPSEIIQDNKNGFLINPTTPSKVSNKILEFFKKTKSDPETWESISQEGIQRVQENFNWDLYSKRLLTLARLYSFWKFAVSMKEKIKMKLYCDLIFDDFYKKRLPKDY
jgi:sucrose synthase